ncbi:MAG: N-acetyltransferase [Dehalococcoidales bacterium]|nr:N-acetyltransferase [Dehalococcoidales bacterium]
MVKIERATIGDVSQIHRLINFFASRGKMLARSLSEIYGNVRDYQVVRDGEQVIACVALHVMWSDLAEIKSLAVAESNQKQGIGERMIRSCLAEAKVLGISTVFCLTYKPELFERVGFSRIDKMELPNKVWTECYRCPKFPNCDEVALVYHTGVQVD